MIQPRRAIQKRTEQQQVIFQHPDSFPCAERGFSMNDHPSPSRDRPRKDSRDDKSPAEASLRKVAVNLKKMKRMVKATEKSDDYCSIRDESFYRHQRSPRRSLYVPEKSFPMLLTYIDVVRQTRSNIDNVSWHTVDDQWTEDGSAYYSERWTGCTRFQILRPRPPTGHTWVNGRPTKIQQTRKARHYLARIKSYIFQETRERRAQ